MTEKPRTPDSHALRDILVETEKHESHWVNTDMLINIVFCGSGTSLNAGESVERIREWATAHGLKATVSGENMVFMKTGK
jgi:hypothetical protein